MMFPRIVRINIYHRNRKRMVKIPNSPPPIQQTKIDYKLLGASIMLVISEILPFTDIESNGIVQKIVRLKKDIETGSFKG